MSNSANSANISKAARRLPPMFGNGLPFLGHLRPFNADPIRLLVAGRAQHCDAFFIKLLGKRIAVLTGPEANEAVFRAPEETLSPREAYRLMTPIFGRGIAYDAEPRIMAEQLGFLYPAVRDDRLRTYTQQMAEETIQSLATWGESGELELVEFCTELTMFIASRCLLGHEFRQHLTGEFAKLYQDMERSLIPIAYFFPNLPLPVFRRRNQARLRMVEVITDIVAARHADGVRGEDFLQTLMEARYQDGRELTEHEITGLLLTIVFAGHHTTATLAAWTFVELLRSPEHLAAILEEQARVLGEDSSVTFTNLKLLVYLERFIMEVERLHPPIIVMMRKAIQDFHFRNWRIPRNSFVMVSPAVSNRDASLFRNADQFDPSRFAPGRDEHRKHPFGITTFGGGMHRCIGQHFAYLQIKTVVSVMLRRYHMELVSGGTSPSYEFMVVPPSSPCIVRYERRA